VERELSTAEWLLILDKTWQAGIPHVTFTGGEPTLRDDLSALIARAEQNGQVCGLLTDGLKLADGKYLDLLLQTGLDHILFILQPANPASWQALETLMPQDIFVTAHLTLNPGTAQDAGATLQKLAALGVRSLSLSSSDPALKDAFKDLQNQAASLGLTLKFDLPVPYSAEHPVAIETQADEVTTGAGKAWLYVEPDGDVLPAQGMAGHILGNLLRDEWAGIYVQPEPATG
jgi:MoaA/NifB/PqqE/SkfB family radical SAM enzyme